MTKGILIGFAFCLAITYTSGTSVGSAPEVWPHTDSETVYYTKQQLEDFHTWYEMGPDIPCQSMAQEAIMTLERIRNHTMNNNHFYMEGYSTYYTQDANCTHCECPEPKE